MTEQPNQGVQPKAASVGARRKKVRLSELRRLQMALTRFSAEVRRAHPSLAAVLGEYNSDMTETIRNADTASAHLWGWIFYRENHKADPIDPGLIAHASVLAESQAQ